MSDEEEVHSAAEEEAPAPRQAAEIKKGGLNEEDLLLLKDNESMRSGLQEEIERLRGESKQRKKERQEYEKQMQERKMEEDAQRKREEEQRAARRAEEEKKRSSARHSTMVTQFIPIEDTAAKLVIQKGAGAGASAGAEEESSGGEKKSKEQLENEKRAILAQRIPAFDISGYDAGKLKEKCKELHSLIFRNESEKYDLEKRFKEQQYDMMELAERARQMNKVGKGGLKRVQLGVDEQDPMQAKLPSAPSKVEMFSKYERQKDKRSYGEKRDNFTGPSHRGPASRVSASRIVKWGEEGLPQYEEIPGKGGDEGGEGEGEE